MNARRGTWPAPCARPWLTAGSQSARRNQQIAGLPPAPHTPTEPHRSVTPPAALFPPEGRTRSQDTGDTGVAASRSQAPRAHTLPSQAPAPDLEGHQHRPAGPAGRLRPAELRVAAVTRNTDGQRPSPQDSAGGVCRASSPPRLRAPRRTGPWASSLQAAHFLAQRKDHASRLRGTGPPPYSHPPGTGSSEMGQPNPGLC